MKYVSEPASVLALCYRHLRLELRCDVDYWVNYTLKSLDAPYCCVNTAVEATTLSDRSFGCMLPQVI